MITGGAAEQLALDTSLATFQQSSVAVENFNMGVIPPGIFKTDRTLFLLDFEAIGPTLVVYLQEVGGLQEWYPYYYVDNPIDMANSQQYQLSALVSGCFESYVS